MRSFRFVTVALLVFATSARAEQRDAGLRPPVLLRTSARQAKPAPSKPAGPQFFTTPLTLDQMRNKQAVIETDLGTIVVDLLPDSAPNHVGFFIKNAQDGTYAGTTFHRVVRHGIIQGGDPLTKDPAKVDVYGT